MQDKNLTKWLGNSKLKDSEDNPLVLFHGTQSEFNIFDLRYTDEENYFGKGFYFTDNYNDAVINYEDIKSPDRTNKKEQIWESVEDFLRDTDSYDMDSDEDSEGYIKIDKILEKLDVWDEEGYTFNQKKEELLQFLQNYQGINFEGKTTDEFKELLSNKIFKSNIDNDISKTLEVYVKMNNPLDIEKEHWEDDFVVGGDIKYFLERFKNSNSDLEQVDEMIEMIISNIQYYMVADSEESGYVTKDSMMEILDISDTETFECENFNKELLVIFFEFWNSDLECDELYGTFINNSKLDQFYKYVTDKNIFTCESDLNNLSDVISSIKDFSITSVAKIFEKLKEGNVFIDLNESENSLGNIFHDFIESLDYDGIIMDANIFTNVMKEVKNTKHYITRKAYNIKLADGTNENFSLYSPDIRFRMIEKKPDNKIDLTVAINEIEKFHNQFPNLPITRIFKKNEDAITYTKKNDECAGFFYNNHTNKFVGIVLENIKDKQDLIQTLLHEHLGHASLQDLLGVNYKSTMLSVYSFFEKNDVIKKDLNLSVKEKVIMAEEHFAIAMEKNTIHKLTLIEKITSKVMSSIRKIFTTTPIIEVEVKKLMVDVIENAKLKENSLESKTKLKI